jgi:hypothetical protein
MGAAMRCGMMRCAAGLPVAAVAGIAAGVGVLLLAGLAGVFVWRRSRRQAYVRVRVRLQNSMQLCMHALLCLNRFFIFIGHSFIHTFGSLREEATQQRTHW